MMLHHMPVLTLRSVVSRNQWYDPKGFAKDQNWEYGPWNMTLEEHALHDGILHPNSPRHRVLLMRSGNLGWIQMYLVPNDSRSVIFSEPMFYVSKYSRSQLIDFSRGTYFRHFNLGSVPYDLSRNICKNLHEKCTWNEYHT